MNPWTILGWALVGGLALVALLFVVGALIRAVAVVSDRAGAGVAAAVFTVAVLTAAIVVWVVASI